MVLGHDVRQRDELEELEAVAAVEVDLPSGGGEGGWRWGGRVDGQGGGEVPGIGRRLPSSCSCLVGIPKGGSDVSVRFNQKR